MGGPAGVAEPGEPARDIGNLRAPPSAEQGKKFTASVHDTKDVDADQALERFGLHPAEGGGDRKGGVVDQQVEAGVLLENQGGEPARGGRGRNIGDVTGDEQAGDFFGCGIERGLVQIDESAAAAGSGELQGESAAESVCRSGDDGGFAAYGERDQAGRARRASRARFMGSASGSPAPFM
jgi:hypothetical protein